MGKVVAGGFYQVPVSISEEVLLSEGVKSIMKIVKKEVDQCVAAAGLTIT